MAPVKSNAERLARTGSLTRQVDNEGDALEPGAPARDGGSPPREPDAALSARLRRLADAIRDGEDAMVEDAILRLSSSRRLFAPLGLAVGGFVMLFDGVKLLLSNWRLTLIQILPAMWIWVAMFDLKAHALHGKAFNPLHGGILIPLVLAVVAITAGCFYLNAVFGFAIAGSRPPQVRPAFAQARTHLRPILLSGVIVGLALALAMLVVPRWGGWWFAICLSIVVGVMMVSYVAVPARLIGVRSTASRRDKLASSAVGGAMGAVVSTPPYILGRIGILMLGSDLLFIPGLILMTVGATLQAGATGAVRTVSMSAKLLGADHSSAPPARERTPRDTEAS